MFVFTSCTNNYIPKARVLASSLKSFHPDWTFCLLLGETPPAGFDLQAEPFDRILTFDQLAIEKYHAWLFRHRVVEICTAAKGPALHYFLTVEGHERVLYLDPDIMVCNPLTPLADLLEEHDILLTPHLRMPQSTPQAVEDNELVALQHGVFNLGFVGVAKREQGLGFAQWWRDRLYQYCYDDIPAGLFTDQRWCDLAPAFFSRLHIVRDPGCNAASWNLTDRTITRGADGVFMANDMPLRFYHFTGFDSGAGAGMTSRYAANMPAVRELWDLYRVRLEAHAHTLLGKLPWKYLSFEDGTPITDPMRLLYRHRQDLQAAFPDPFVVPGYLDWYRADQQLVSAKKYGLHRLRSLLDYVRWQIGNNGGMRHAPLRLTRKAVHHVQQRGLRSMLHTVWHGVASTQDAAPDDLVFLEDLLALPTGAAQVREFLAPANTPILLVEHDWGGGANMYAESRVADFLMQGKAVARLRYSLAGRRLELTILHGNKSLHCAVASLETLVQDTFPRLSHVMINELASWYLHASNAQERLQQSLEILARLIEEHHAHSEYLFHDFFAICPTINLVREGVFCGLAQDNIPCGSCLDAETLQQWRSMWGTFLANIETVVFFSKSAHALVRCVIALRPEQVAIRPHSLPSCFSRKIRIPSSGPMRVAVVGYIQPHKGAEIVRDLAHLLYRHDAEASILIFGQLDLSCVPQNVHVLGTYARKDLPDLLEREGITVAMFPSLCPETFSFVTNELAALGVPLASFNIGAQAECVAGLEQGRLASALSAEAMLEALLELDTLRRQASDPQNA